MLLKYKYHILTLLLLLLGTFTYSNLLVDSTLTIRFLSTFFALTLIFLLSYPLIINYLKVDFNVADGLFLIFCLWQLVSILWSTNKAEAFGDSFKAIAMFYVYLYFRSLLVSGSHWKNTLALLFSIVFSFYLVITWINIIDIQELLGFNAQSAYLLRYPSGHKNLISIYILGSLTFSAFLLKEKNRWKRILAWVNLIAGMITLFILTTRSVSVGLFVVALFFMISTIFRKISLKKGLIISVSFLIIALSHWFFSKAYKETSLKSYYPTEIANNPKKQTDIIEHANRSTNERIIIWKKTLKLISEEPFLGVGAGNWKIEFPRNGYSGIFRAEFFNTTFNRPHNDFLWIFSELGVFAFLVFLVVLFLFVKNAWKGDLYNLIIIAGLLAYLTVSFFDFPRERGEHTILFAGLLAMLAQPWNLKSIKFRKIKSFYFLGLFLLIFGGVIYAYRFVGEKIYHQVRMIKSQQKYSEVIKKSNEAENIFYTVDYLNIPLKWYSAISYTYMGKFDMGEQEFKKALQLNPTNFHTLNNLGFCLASQEKYSEAIPYLIQSLNINEYFEDSRFNLSFSYMMNEQYEAASSILQEKVKDQAKRELYLKEISRLSTDSQN